MFSQKLFDNEHEREILLTTLIKHIRAGNAIDDEIKLVLQQEFDMRQTQLIINEKAIISLFIKNLPFKGDQPITIESVDSTVFESPPLYEGEHYFLENPGDFNYFKNKWKKEALCNSYIDSISQIRIALRLCVRLETLSYCYMFKMAMRLSLCCQVYRTVQKRRSFLMDGNIICALKQQLQKLECDVVPSQVDFNEIINILSFNVHLLDLEINNPNNPVLKKKLEVYMITAIIGWDGEEVDFFKSFWTLQLRYFAIKHHAIVPFELKGKHELDNYACDLMRRAGEYSCLVFPGFFEVTEVENTRKNAFSAMYFYSLVIWLQRAGLLSSEMTTLALYAKSEKADIMPVLLACKERPKPQPVTIHVESAEKIKSKKHATPEKKPILTPMLILEEERMRLARQQAADLLKEQEAARRAARLQAEAEARQEQAEKEKKIKAARKAAAQLKKENAQRERDEKRESIAISKALQLANKKRSKNKKVQKMPVENTPVPIPPPIPVPIVFPLHDFSLDEFDEQELSLDNRHVLQKLDSITEQYNGHFEIYGSYVAYLAMCRLHEEKKIRPSDLDVRIEIKTLQEEQLSVLVAQLMVLQFHFKDPMYDTLLLTDYCKSQAYKGYLHLCRIPQDHNLHSYAIELNLVFSVVYRKNTNPFHLTNHTIFISGNRASFDNGNLLLQEQLQLHIKQKIFSVDVLSLMTLSSNVFKFFPRAFKNKKSWSEFYSMDPESMERALTEVYFITEFFRIRFADRCCHKSCYLEMVGLIVQGDFTLKEAIPVIKGFLISILEVLNKESLRQQCKQVFNAAELQNAVENMSAFLQAYFQRDPVVVENNKNSSNTILNLFQAILMKSILEEVNRQQNKTDVLESARFVTDRVWVRGSVLYQYSAVKVEPFRHTHIVHRNVANPDSYAREFKGR